MTQHDGHAPTSSATPTEQPRDPVCGMFVGGPLFALHGDVRYHFCSERCRQKFLDEHVHSEDEVRFFVRGQGLFYLHFQEQVYAVLCQKNDLISVPDGTRHWFDMGPQPRFTCIRLFSNPEGWVADFTGEDIARQLPRYEQLAGVA